MTIDVFWDDPEKTILRWDFHPGWTWKDHETALAKTRGLMQDIDHNVFYIRNLNNTAPPAGQSYFVTIVDIVRRNSHLLMKVEFMAVIQPVQEAKSLGSYFLELLKTKFQVFESLDDAYAEIEKRTAASDHTP